MKDVLLNNMKTIKPYGGVEEKKLSNVKVGLYIDIQGVPRNMTVGEWF